MPIVHAAAVQLDSPLAGLAARAGEHACDLVGATLRAFTALVDHTIDIAASLLVVPGDLYAPPGLCSSPAFRFDCAGTRGDLCRVSLFSRRLSWLRAADHCHPFFESCGIAIVLRQVAGEMGDLEVRFVIPAICDVDAVG